MNVSFLRKLIRHFVGVIEKFILPNSVSHIVFVLYLSKFRGFRFLRSFGVPFQQMKLIQISDLFQMIEKDSFSDFGLGKTKGEALANL